jgi:LAGLIDADG endonuclease
VPSFIPLAVAVSPSFWSPKQHTQCKLEVGSSETARCIITHDFVLFHALFFTNLTMQKQFICKSKSSMNTIKLQWLSGLIDGDGCFLISTKKYASLEITASYVDESMLQQVKQLFGGSIKARAGLKALRYRLHHTSGLVQLVNSVNGFIRNSIRQQQLKKILNLFNIPYIEPAPFHWQSAYACGLFDSDGSVILSVKQHNALTGPDQKGVLGKIARLKDAKQTQLTIKITQKYKINLKFLTTPMEPRANRKTPLVLPRSSIKGQSFYRDQKLDTYCITNSLNTCGQSFGNMHFDKSQNGSYSWTISSKTHIMLWLYYTTQYPCYSKKAHRLRLIESFYKLYSQKAHLADESSNLKRQWNVFATDWHRYS